MLAPAMDKGNPVWVPGPAWSPAPREGGGEQRGVSTANGLTSTCFLIHSWCSASDLSPEVLSGMTLLLMTY